jgi:hypothetical protein
MVEERGPGIVQTFLIHSLGAEAICLVFLLRVSPNVHPRRDGDPAAWRILGCRERKSPLENPICSVYPSLVYVMVTLAVVLRSLSVQIQLPE